MHPPATFHLPARISDVAQRQHGLVTSTDLLQLDVGQRTVKRWVEVGRLEPAGRGVYRVGGCPITTDSRILAAVLIHGDGTWASNRTSAWMWEVEGFGRPGRIEVLRLEESSTESELDLLGRAVLDAEQGIEWQVPLSDHQGYIRRVDGLHRTGKVVIEWDGAEFHDAATQRALDIAGDERLRALGYAVLRFRWFDVTMQPSKVRSDVRSHVARGSKPAAA